MRVVLGNAEQHAVSAAADAYDFYIYNRSPDGLLHSFSCHVPASSQTQKQSP